MNFDAAIYWDYLLLSHRDSNAFFNKLQWTDDLRLAIAKKYKISMSRRLGEVKVQILLTPIVIITALRRYIVFSHYSYSM